MATIKDVAQDAGVAVGTVSKVLNNKYVTEANRIKVERSIEKLGYQVNTYAQGMKSQFTKTAALILPNLYNPFFALLANHIENELYARDYRMLLCNSDGRAEKEIGYFKMALQNKVDGIIGLTYSDAEKYFSEDFPMISIDRYYESNIPCVSSDNYRGGELAAEIFQETGCGQVAYIRTGYRINGNTLNRGKGFKDACAAYGMECEEIDLGEHILPDTASKAAEYLKRRIKNGRIAVDGLFFSSDDLAILVRDELREMGLRVPEDIQVIGFDGLTVFNREKAFVSSIRQPVEEIARVSVEMLMKIIHGEKVAIQTLLPVEFLDGGTTKALPRELFGREA